MNDSADIKMAANRLQQALRTLEGSLNPLLERVSRLESSARETETLKQDRVSMAADLDNAKAREQSFAAREAEFNALADETTQELDRVIRQVRGALEEG